MKETNKKKTIITVGLITVLLCTIGATYAYFTAMVNKEGDNTVNIKTEALANATMEMGNKIEASGVLPGYKVVKTVRVTGSGPENAKPVNAVISLIPNVTDFSNHIEYEVYALDNPNDVNTNNICSESNKHTDNNQYYDEMTCNTTNLGEKVTSGTFNKRIPVGIDIEVERNTDRTYYILVKYVNDEENPQDQEQGKRFTINIDFGEELAEYHPLAVDYITELASSSNEIVDDETEDHNLRYIGANPSNYLIFNNELWRIIGVMNDVADENGVIEPRVKLIRSESIGNYSWDNKASGTGSSDSQYGSNDWTDSAIKEVLNNGAYYNRTSGSCPNERNGSTTSCDFSNTGLASEAKSMISKVTWKLGGTGLHTTTTASMFYDTERGTEVYSGRPTEWIGEVGLMYPSDYGYATSGGSTIDRNACLNKEIYNWKESGVNDCKNNDWLFSLDVQWTITPRSLSSSVVFAVGSSEGRVYVDQTYSTYAVRPVVYLNTNIKIKSGIGTETNPFILSA